ncbi:hypothetical protein SM120_04070 [Lactococcus lactis subsp. lactis]|uniref:Uncharacterized protein n=1 Tax=Lactococcus lactis TaxID=1358 RepID=A0AAP8E0X0_9LACT|nr:hypothetical protein [Lactococcus lactis]MDG4971441.1 hypothetical protein [Lactococcus lactis]MDY4362825.1 hypothetical protein [Lactococcus lactis subsp. lactis]PFG88790.1 hypothetical protein BW154_04645 [Lactococcus lactis]WKK96125.1 hypothetical protein LLUC11_02705 [Lactococcus lactis subsp. lactis]
MKAKPRYLNKVSKHREDIGSMIINGKYCDFDSERLKRELSELEIKENQQILQEEQQLQDKENFFYKIISFVLHIRFSR